MVLMRKTTRFGGFFLCLDFAIYCKRCSTRVSSSATPGLAAFGVVQVVNIKRQFDGSQIREHGHAR